jgi:hypothetical protein
MGLDIHLLRRVDFRYSRSRPIIKHPLINPERVVFITEEVGYWRSNRGLLAWFHTQRGKPPRNNVNTPISRVMLRRLVKYFACAGDCYGAGLVKGILDKPEDTATYFLHFSW